MSDALDPTVSPTTPNLTPLITCLRWFTFILVIVLGVLIIRDGSFYQFFGMHSPVVTSSIPVVSHPATVVTTSPASEPTDTSAELGTSSAFAPGKMYFSDTLMLVGKDDPHQSLIITISRLEDNLGLYTQGTRVSYFDGASWTRDTDTRPTTADSWVYNRLLRGWTTYLEKSRVLRERIDGDIKISGHQFTFTASDLANEMTIRARPGYTKISSVGTGILTVDGVSQDVYVLYIKLYSLDTSDLQFYDDTLSGVETDWVAFWDTAGNFYHVDVTDIATPTPIYESHQIGIWENPVGSVTKTFAVTVSRDQNLPPDTYHLELAAPVDATLDFTRQNSLTKVDTTTTSWYLSQVAGTATIDGVTTPGIGIIEYINEK